jgi:predicted Zn-dependent peptidase
MKLRVCLVFALAALACGGPKPAEAPPPRARTDAGAPVAAADSKKREAPPPPGLPPSAPFPDIQHRDLDNGMKLRVVRHGNYPIVELRLVVLSGLATDGEKNGLALLAGEMLKAGGAGKWDSRQLLERAESLGSTLEILTTRDATQVSLGVTKHNLDAALEIIAAVAQSPKFVPVEFTKLQQREIERVSSLARTSGRWAANMVLYQQLFELPTGVHAYSHYDATPEDLKKITLADCRRWHAQHVTPQNSFLVLAGDLDADSAKEAVAKSFAKWRGKVPERPNFSRPMPPSRTTVYIADRPQSAQSEILVATLGPERKSDVWAALRAADQVLGGGVAGRLFLDVREKRSLAYSTYSDVAELAQGPVPILLSAGTQTPKTGHAVKALIEHYEKMGSSAPTPEEVEIATRYLSDSFLLRMETIGAIANMTAHLGVLGLPDEYYDDYRKAVRAIEPKHIAEVGRSYFRAGNTLVIVSGDAERIAKPLSRFGEVHILDPEKGFSRKKSLPPDANAALDIDAAKPAAEKEAPKKAP